MKGDHKRKAVTLPPANVTVSSGEILVVVPDILGKNASHQSGRFLSPQCKQYRKSVHDGAAKVLFATSMYWARYGAWRLEVLGVWPRQNHRVGLPDIPDGDCDAAIPQALDALQHAGLLDNDARVVEVRAWNMYRKDERWTVIRLCRVDVGLPRPLAAFIPKEHPCPPVAKTARTSRPRSPRKTPTTSR